MGRAGGGGRSLSEHALSASQCAQFVNHPFPPLMTDAGFSPFALTCTRTHRRLDLPLKTKCIHYVPPGTPSVSPTPHHLIVISPTGPVLAFMVLSPGSSRRRVPCFEGCGQRGSKGRQREKAQPAVTWTVSLGFPATGSLGLSAVLRSRRVSFPAGLTFVVIVIVITHWA